MDEPLRLGAVIDDYCTKCKGVMNHSVVSLDGDQPARTECRTCFTAHKYRNAQGKKQQEAKQDLFDEVLDKIGPLGHR